MRFALLFLLVVAAACTDTPTANELAPTRFNATDEVLYEVFVRDFTPEGTFRAIIPRLGELKALGATTLWLMPIHPLGEAKRKGTLGSPYAVRDYFDTNPRFGTREDLRALVDAAHAEGLKVILDWVANHTAWDNAWVEAHPDWYTRNADGDMKPPVPDWSDVADLDFDQADLRSEMLRAMRYWVEEYDIDGYRCDVAEMVPGDFWANAIAELRTVKPVLMLAEGADPVLYEHGFDLTYAWDPYHRLKDVWRGEAWTGFVAAIETERRTVSRLDAKLRFTTNHDETAWDDTPVGLFNGIGGAQAAAVATTLLPGAPLVYNGQEVADSTQLGLFEKTDIAWQANPEMRAFYEALLAFRNGSDAVLAGDLRFIEHLSDEHALLYERMLEGRRVLVAVNARNRTVPVALGTAAPGDWTTTLGSPALVENGALPPYGWAVLTAEA